MNRRVTQSSVPLALKLPTLLSVEEVAAAIHRHPEVVRRQARNGRLPAEKIGRVWFFRPERLTEAGFSQFLPQMAKDALPEQPPATFDAASQTAATPEAERLLQTDDAMVATLAGAMSLRQSLHARAPKKAELAERLAEHVELDAGRRRRVRYAALLQDLGKLGLPDGILKKQARLDGEERALMMTHPVVAADLLARFKPLADLAPLVRSHHEWFNGEGYPDGLKGEAIPLETRIVSVVNAFFNVTFDLPVKSEGVIEDGLEEMMRFKGINLDPVLTEAFITMYRKGQAAKAPWYLELRQVMATSEPPPSSGPRDILSVADSRELRIIYRIAQEMTAVLDLDTLLKRIVGIVREVMGYYMVSILLPTETSGELRLGAQSGYAIDITGLIIGPGQGITGWVYAHGIPQIIADVGADARYVGLDDQVRSELAFPLVSRGRIVGVLNAESEHPDAFTETDLALMSAVGSQLASCLVVAQLHDSLKREANHDPLTRLYNRRLFLERIQQEVGRAKAAQESFSILFLDVNDLKRVNDTYGHLAGDALLREVSNALMDAVRGEDVVARYGGDEFIVLLPATGAAAAATVAARLADGISRHRFMAGRELLQIPGVSLGIATFPGDGVTADQLLASADATLYEQKRKAS